MKTRPETWYDFFIPGSEVLENALGIHDPEVLELAERKFSQVRQLVGADIIPQTFDFDHLKTIHLNMFQDLYPTWAGEVRPVGISKGVSFTEPEHIEPFARQIFDQLADDNFLRDLSRDSFVDKATDLLGNINALHPFREGNGRTQREFLRQLADAAGFEFDMSMISEEQNIEASFLSLAKGDDSQLRDMVDTAIQNKNP